MDYRGNPGRGGILGFPPMISQLVLITVAVYLLQQLVPTGMLYRIQGFGPAISGIPNGFALVPNQVLTRGMVWELVTYMFLHGGTLHILFNMFLLVMAGSELERYWGGRDFLKYYLITGIGAGVIHMISVYAFGGNPLSPTVGASGAVFGLLMAYALAFPDRQILLWFVIPVQARVMVAILAFIQVAALSQDDGVARFAHLGGMLVGYLYLKQEVLLWRVKRLLRGFRTTQSPRPPQETGEDPQVQARIDEILEKISSEGMGSLSVEEKRILRESAERARRRQQGHDG